MHRSGKRRSIIDKDLGTAYVQSVIRLANVLINKSDAFLKRYAALPQMQGRSYVVAISNYGTQDFNMIGMCRRSGCSTITSTWARS
jgi:hypothetical protein